MGKGCLSSFKSHIWLTDSHSSCKTTCLNLQVYVVPPPARPCPASGPPARPCSPSPDPIYKVPRGSGTQPASPGEILEVRARGLCVCQVRDIHMSYICHTYICQGGSTAELKANSPIPPSRSTTCPTLLSGFPPAAPMTPQPPFPALWPGLPHSPLERMKFPMMGASSPQITYRARARPGEGRGAGTRASPLFCPFWP
jgi:hypothetical protein